MVTNATVSTYMPQENAILVGVASNGGTEARLNLYASLDELASLANGAGAKVVARITQHLSSRSPTYLGQGKLRELKELQKASGSTVVIFNDELTPTQQRNLERELAIKVLDRSALILDIFAKQARTREGVLQVDLAQHQYLLPRLAGQWSHLERLGGGIGTRGPGETQLETDRRLIRKRIKLLEGQLESVRHHRNLYRRRRYAAKIPVVSLVGYTNAGKSTLFRSLARTEVLAEDRPFSTLDPITKRIMLPTGTPVLLTDTVGFIHNLPAQLIAAFRATLEELADAHLLLHVVDISKPQAEARTNVVTKTLKQLGLSSTPTILVENKYDLVDATEGDSLPLSNGTSPTTTAKVSALKGTGRHELLIEIANRLPQI